MIKLLLINLHPRHFFLLLQLNPDNLKLQFEKELWALNPELALIDTILNSHSEIIEMVREDITGGKEGSHMQEEPELICHKAVAT